jgi:hypothetical protein
VNKPATILSLALAVATAGCSTDQIARVVYYTFRVENQAVDATPPMQSRGAPMSFDRYQQERRGEASR